MKILVTRRNGSQTEIELLAPLEVREHEEEKFTMAVLHGGDGFDHYFNKDDGTYDGWGAACCSTEHAEELLGLARADAPPPEGR